MTERNKTVSVDNDIVSLLIYNLLKFLEFIKFSSPFFDKQNLPAYLLRLTVYSLILFTVHLIWMKNDEISYRTYISSHPAGSFEVF